MARKSAAHDLLALARRLRRVLKPRRGLSEKAMFGGICFLDRGNMLCGTAKQGFMFRIGKDQDAAALARPGARPMDFTGRPMAGFVWVDPAACDARALRRWVALAEGYVAALPARSK